MNNKQTLELFEGYLVAQFSDYCRRHHTKFEVKSLLTYLIDKGFIGDASIRRFVIQQEFKYQLPKHKNRTEAVIKISDKLNLSQRTVWSALRK